MSAPIVQLEKKYVQFFLRVFSFFLISLLPKTSVQAEAELQRLLQLFQLQLAFRGFNAMSTKMWTQARPSTGCDARKGWLGEFSGSVCV